jgi:hypothetical protein
MDQSLLYDKRFSQWFPKSLVASQKKTQGKPETGHVPSADVYGARGNIISTAYDRRLADGVTQATALQNYLASMVSRAAAKPSAGSSQSRFYLRKLVQLYNSRGVTPLLVIMPYHPDALSAFRSVGWEDKVRTLKRYLAKLQERYDVRVVDYTEISSFGGKARWFYDGAHVMKQNADRILARAVKQAPVCFK